MESCLVRGLGGDVDDTIQLSDQDKSKRRAQRVVKRIHGACMDTEGLVDEDAVRVIPNSEAEAIFWPGL